MSTINISRRQFIQTGVITSAAGVALIGAVGCDSPKSGNEAGADKKTEQPAATGCTDVSGLSDGDKKAREGLKYVDVTTIAEKNCANCQLYVAAAAGASCGTCKVVKGPIAPKGYCTAWAKMA